MRCFIVLIATLLSTKANANDNVVVEWMSKEYQSNSTSLDEDGKPMVFDLGTTCDFFKLAKARGLVCSVAISSVYDSEKKGQPDRERRANEVIAATQAEWQRQCPEAVVTHTYIQDSIHDFRVGEVSARCHSPR